MGTASLSVSDRKGWCRMYFAGFETVVSLLGIASTLMGILVTVVSIVITVVVCTHPKNKK